MRLDDEEAGRRLAEAGHGVLATVHRSRGVDAVPCVFALVDGHVGVPVDTVKAKAKASTVLQRERNLALDPRATLLVEHWDEADWSQLWWARAELRHVPDPPDDRTEALASELARRFVPYRDRPFERIIVLRVAAASGWTAPSDGATPEGASGLRPTRPSA